MSAPGGPHVGPMNLAIRGAAVSELFYLGSGSLCGRSECLPTLTENSYRYGNFMYQYTIFHTLLTMLCKTFNINTRAICFAIKCTSLDHSVTCLVLTGWIFVCFLWYTRCFHICRPNIMVHSIWGRNLLFFICKINCYLANNSWIGYEKSILCDSRWLKRNISSPQLIPRDYVTYFTKEVHPGLSEPRMNFDGGLAKLGLISLVKLAYMRQ